MNRRCSAFKARKLRERRNFIELISAVFAGSTLLHSDSPRQTATTLTCDKDGYLRRYMNRFRGPFHRVLLRLAHRYVLTPIVRNLFDAETEHKLAVKTQDLSRHSVIVPRDKGLKTKVNMKAWVATVHNKLTQPGLERRSI